MKVKTHKPNSMLWLIAFLLFVYSIASMFVPLLPYGSPAMIFSAALLLLGTTIV